MGVIITMGVITAIAVGTVFGVVGTIFGLKTLQRKVLAFQKEQKLKALPAGENEADATIRKALAEGLLTDAELVEIGIDPEQYREVQKIEEPETKATLINQFVTMSNKLGMLNMADINRRFTEIRNIEIRTNGAYFSAGSIKTTGNTSINIQGGNISITTGGGSGQPMQPMQPMRPMRPMRPIRPVRPVRGVRPVRPINKGAHAGWARQVQAVKRENERQLQEWKRECERINREYQQEIREWKQDCKRVEQPAQAMLALGDEMEDTMNKMFEKHDRMFDDLDGPMPWD